ncbi:sensor histidine kinase [Chromatocurvus halotolerans]|uniref:histidine kinase n=1 Tax=Chromatocurvus halotolerans TaxID=1132028 RepID=A0A4R2L9C0_9GAMM|nr:HAMP domain-containing sensor histidine kinase [Chromatocurvus halotolerans]TCO75835.1 signal transduction histidine kinase [Chromatocurvus halotolerans]
MADITAGETGTHSDTYDLRRAMLLGILAPIALLSAALVLVVALWAERSLEARLQGEIELIARAVAPSISTRLVESDIHGIRNSLDSLFSIRRVYGVAVYNVGGELLVAAGTADNTLRGSLAASGVVSSGQDEGGYREVDGQTVYAYFTPLLDRDGRIQGLLQMTRQRQEITDALKRLHLTAWSLWFFAVFAAIVITLQLYRRLIGTRVAMLLTSIDAFARGERELKLAIRAPREFADIGNSLNSMARATREAEIALAAKQNEERALQRRLDQSERAAEIGRVAEGLAHELGAPLTVIDGRVRQMERRPDAPGTTGAMQEVRQQVQRMGNIVRQLLSYARRENSGHDAIELANLVERVCQGSAADAPQPELTCKSQAIIQGDRVRIEMAVANIVRNAQRHAQSSVSVTVERRGGNAVVRVEDDGPGVTTDDEQEIFKPFFSREPTGSGSGLGLAIVSNIMQEHGGNVGYSRGSRGAIFELVFPSTDSEDNR